MHIEDTIKNWGSCARELRAGKANEKDIEATKSISSIIHELDKLAFHEALPFRFCLFKIESDYAIRYDGTNYNIHVPGLHNHLIKAKDNLNRVNPPEKGEFSDQDMINYVIAAEIVRYRAQNELSIQMFTPEHAGSFTEVPGLNRVIQNAVQIKILVENPDLFDARIIGTYASSLIDECNRDSSDSKEIKTLIGYMIKAGADLFLKP